MFGTFRLILLAFTAALLFANSALAAPCLSYTERVALEFGAENTAVAFNSADKVNGGTASLGVDSSYGLDAALCIPTSETFELILAYRSDQTTVSAPATKTLAHNSETLGTQEYGFKKWSEDQRTGFSLVGGTQAVSQFRGLTSTQLTLENITVPYAGVGLTWNFKNGHHVKMGLDFSARYYFPATSGLDQLSGNIGFGSDIYFLIELSKRFALQLDAAATLQGENSGLVVQQQTNYDLGGRFIFHF